VNRNLKGYYLPPSLEYLEDKLEFRELSADGFNITVPKISKDIVIEIVSTIRNSRDKYIANISIEEIAEIYDRVSRKWKNNDYEKKKVALDVLPKLTNLSKEIIEYYQFRTIYKINKETILFLSHFVPPKEVFKKFIKIEKSKSMLRAFGSLFSQLKLAKALKSKKEIKLITYITPSNVPGLIECLGMFLSSIVKASSVIKSPSMQPVFAPLFAESILEESKEIGETIAVIPWKGGTIEIEDILFINSEAVSVVSSTETALSVKRRIDDLNKKGCNIKGCYHGGKFGLEIIGREYCNRDVAGLAVIDGFGYEGYMCSSPVFGFFVEKGGKYSPEDFAKFMVKEAELLEKVIPQSEYFKKLREKQVARLIAKEGMDKDVKIYTSPEHDFAVVYEPRPTLNPIGQNRLFRVMPLSSVEDIFPMLKPWKDYLQSIGVALLDSRLLQFAEKAGKIGFTNIRVTGTLTLPRLGESWDGNLPVAEFYIPDIVRWVSINTISIDEEIKYLIDEKNKLINKGVWSLEG